MYYNVKVMISNRHVHLTKETYEKLFDEPLTKKSDLNQIGQFAANQTVDILTDKFEFKDVRIVGPFRDYNQVEISNNDARKSKSLSASICISAAKLSADSWFSIADAVFLSSSPS